MKPFVFLLLAFAALLAACRPAAPPVSVSNRPIIVNGVPQTNVPMPPAGNLEDFGWTLFDGRRQPVKDFKGKVLILDFWATYCPPCIEEIPHLNALQEQYGADNLQIIGLHVGGEDDQPKIPSFVERLKIAYPLAYPQDELTDFLMGSDPAIPQTFVFDREGKLVKKFVGFDDEIKVALDKAVEQAARTGTN